MKLAKKSSRKSSLIDLNDRIEPHTTTRPEVNSADKESSGGFLINFLSHYSRLRAAVSSVFRLNTKYPNTNYYFYCFLLLFLLLWFLLAVSSEFLSKKKIYTSRKWPQNCEQTKKKQNAIKFV